MKLFNPTQCLCFPSDAQSNGRRLQTVLLDVEYRGMGHSLTHILCWHKFLGKKEERLSGENILSGSLMRGITSKSLHKHSHHPPSISACQSGYQGSWRKYRSCHWNSKLRKFWMIDVHHMTCWFANTVKLKKYYQLNNILMWAKGHWRPKVHVKHDDKRRCTVAVALGSHTKNS